MNRTSLQVYLVVSAVVFGCGGDEDDDGDDASSAAKGGSSAGSSNTNGGSAGIASGGKGEGGRGGSSGTGGRGGTGGKASAGTGGDAGAGNEGGEDNGGSSSGGRSGTGGVGGTGITEPCTEPVIGLPDDAPDLEPGVWTDISPPSIEKGDPEYMLGQGIAVDPCNPAVIYWGNTPFYEETGGLWKTTNAGATWVKLGDYSQEPDDFATAYLDQPVHVRIDPRDTQHLYAGDGVRGSTLGFWESFDGGQTWEKPRALRELADQMGYFVDDVYDVAVNPTDFDHVLISSHSPWDNDGAGVLESRDGGDTWVAHDYQSSWGAGHSIDFLYEPTQGIGDEDTWLLGTQSGGYWRTDDGGENWTRVRDEGIFHGGGDSYYTKMGVLYASSYEGVIRSEDNGESWTVVATGLGTTAVYGDGNTLYTSPAYGYNEQPFLTAPEDDGTAREWEPSGRELTDGGPFEMAFDATNGILYASCWFQGVWALKVE
jgi:hypothetical protein